MKIRFPATHRRSWRDRFVEIGRQAEGSSQAPRALLIAAGLKLRGRTSAFASPGRARPA